jgi:hypothetical protein
MARQTLDSWDGHTGTDLGDVGSSLSRFTCPLRGKSIDDDDEKTMGLRRNPDRT